MKSRKRKKGRKEERKKKKDGCMYLVIVERHNRYRCMHIFVVAKEALLAAYSELFTHLNDGH